MHRPRVNQPVGFLISQITRPTYYYGRRHDYVYYPESWTDSASGTYYEKGYYDENGKYYDSVSFQKNGTYENVLCKCPYCGTETVMNLDNRAGSAQTLQCPGCGAPMEIKSELDEILDQPAENTHVYNSEASLGTAFGQTKKKKGHGLVIALALFVFLIVSSAVKNVIFRPDYQQTIEYPPTYQQFPEPDNNAGFSSLPQDGQMIYLEEQGDGSFHVVTDPIRADRILTYDRSADSYYDEASDCWLWYNTDVSPAIWQYWYEGISSDYGDYGWMEHDSEGWWIEAAEGSWIPLPSAYDSRNLWYIS